MRHICGHTRALLTESAKPSYIGRAEVAQSIEGFFATLEGAGAQALKGRSLLNLARIGETDAAVSGKFDSLTNSYGAMQRIAHEMERLAADLLLAFDQVTLTTKELKQLADGEEGETG